MSPSFLKLYSHSLTHARALSHALARLSQLLLLGPSILAIALHWRNGFSIALKVWEDDDIDMSWTKLTKLKWSCVLASRSFQLGSVRGGKSGGVITSLAVSDQFKIVIRSIHERPKTQLQL